MKSYSLAILLSLAAATNAHFQLTFPPSRGDDDETQATGPCGGLDTPSTTRTPWPLTGGTLKFEAGHDEADTAVYLALGNNPSAKDFNITIAPVFLQTGLGTFCWNTLAIPAGIAGIANGVNATIQVIQAGHTGGGLYNVCASSIYLFSSVRSVTASTYLTLIKQCADITFVSEAPMMSSDCANSTGVGAEAATPANSPATNGTPASSAHPGATSTGAASTLTGSVMAAGILAMFGFIL